MTDPLLMNFADQELAAAWHKDIYAYWQALRGDRIMPSRKMFDPLQVPAALGKIMIIEVGEPPEKYKFRLIGTEITLLAGFDANGQRFMELPDIERVTHRFDWLLENKRPYYVHDIFFWSEEDRKEERFAYNSLVLPFSENNIDVNFIFNCLDIVKLPPVS